MDQPEPPPDVSLALNAPRTLHPTVLRAVQPYPKLERWGFLHYPADASSRDFTQILGVEYTLLDLIELSEDQTPEAELPDNSDGAVIRLLRKNPADRRMQYRYWLERAVQVAVRRQSPDAPWLMGEQLHWVSRDLDEMNAKLAGDLPYSIEVLRSQPETCWEWQRPLDPGRKYPTTSSWRGMQHITVHRLLWPIVKPELPFRSRPARDCGNNLCVNPLHFYDSSARARAFNMGPGKGNRSKDDASPKTANTIPYYMEDVHSLGGGKFELRCPRCKTPASDYYQALVNRSWAQGWRGDKHGKMGTMFCRFCHAVYMADRNARKPVPRLNPPQRGLTEGERFDLAFKARDLAFDEQPVDDGWGRASNWRTSPELIEDSEPGQKPLPPGFTPGWSEEFKKKIGYDPDDPA